MVEKVTEERSASSEAWESLESWVRGTTVPKEIRQQLGVGPSDVLQWKVVGDHVLVTAATPAFLALQGIFKVGPGDPVQDVRRARQLIGINGI